MFDLDHDLNKEHGIDLVAYMYGELDQASRSAFEAHLTTCDHCAFELGSFANARLGVIEWRREDFDPLATPVILVPENRPISAFTDRPGVSGSIKRFWDAVLSFPLATRVGTGLTAASLVAAVLYFTTISGRPTSEIADQNSTQGVSNGVSVATPEVPIRDTAQFKSPTEPKQVKPEKVVDRRPAPRVQLASSRIVVKPAFIKSVRPRSETATTKAPRLNNVDEEEDKSLRLTDLFAEIGSSEE
jgi:hypothetical protein